MTCGRADPCPNTPGWSGGRRGTWQERTAASQRAGMGSSAAPQRWPADPRQRVPQPSGSSWACAWVRQPCPQKSVQVKEWGDPMKRVPSLELRVWAAEGECGAAQQA